MISIGSSSLHRGKYVIVLAGMSMLPFLLETATIAKTETLPVQKAAPSVVVLETAGSESELRRLMREKNRVSALQEKAVRFSEASPGSYGFIAPKQLGLVLVTQSPDLVLEQAPSSAHAYEIHKLADGSGLLVGFLGQEAIAHIKPSERHRKVRLSLYSNLVREAPYIVAVPLTKLVVDQMPRLIRANTPEGSAMLEMDLEGTANRKVLGQ
ncbi:MAG: hypothetical protein NNA18_06720 [Nitrospira sp.]|nr:hypothetical protein [Nitrospira sp.]